MEARATLTKLVQMRQRLQAAGQSHRNGMAFEAAKKRLKQWLDFNQRATDAQVRRFVAANKELVLLVAPPSWADKIERLINDPAASRQAGSPSLSLGERE